MSQATTSSPIKELGRAVGEGDLRKIQRLVGDDLCLLASRGPDGLTPLMWAAGGTELEIVKWILEKLPMLQGQDADDDKVT
jgi:hypothetical protein